MSQKRCLNCQEYRPDEMSFKGSPLQPGEYPNAGICQRSDTRKRDGWACGDWVQKSPIMTKGDTE